MGKAGKKLTRESGAPVANHQDVITAGPRGPMVMQDVWFLEKMAHFDREVIPERRMHAKGSGAFGKFTVTNDVTKYTRDPIRFTDLNHAVKRDPKTNMRSPQSNWDFWTMLPEALHQITIVMSDRGLPDGYRHTHGFGSHTFSLINKKNERFWVKFHLKSQQGIKNLTNEEAAAIVGKDRESAQHDLFHAIEKGDFPRWKMCIQIMTEEQAKKHKDNPFDITKVWSHKEYPLIDVGILELNRNPENYFADVEQAAFNPASVVPGVGFSPDKLLQGRLFSYGDAQRYRLGVNHASIPVNAPKCPVHAYHRDGLMRVDGNYGAAKGYHPNSFGEWAEQKEFAEPPLAMEGTVDHHDPYKNDDCFYQPGDLFRLMTEDKRSLLIKNTAADIAPVTDNIKYRHAAHCYLADQEYGKRIAKALGLKLEKVVELSEMSREARLNATSEAEWK